MKTIYLNERNYYQVDDIRKEALIYCKGARSSRDLMKKKNIKSKNFIYARFKKGEWVITDGKSAKYDKVLIRVKYVKTVNNLWSELQGEDVMDENGIESAPPIIDLEDHEKFQDDNGNIIEIETRGEREVDGVYFKVKDVAEGFEIASLYKNMINDQTLYDNGIDYKYFICEKVYNVVKKTSKTTSTKKELFLTYEGLLRVLFVSRSGKANKFVKWATNILFTVQMGTKEAKQELCNEITGVQAKSCVDVFKRATSNISCVYLYSLGRVKDLRDSMSIDDKHGDGGIVCKFGFTNNLERRTRDHIKTYGCIKGADVRIMKYCNIDKQFIQDAENDLKEMLKPYKLEYMKQKELIVIDENMIGPINKYYEGINKNYIGTMKEIDDELKRVQLMLDFEKEKNLQKDELIKQKDELIKQKEELAKQKDLLIEAEKEKLVMAQENSELMKKMLAMYEKQNQ